MGLCKNFCLKIVVLAQPSLRRTHFLVIICDTGYPGDMKRIALTVATVLLASIGFIPTAQATEKELANPNLFRLKDFVEVQQNEIYKYKCTYPAWDPKSKLTEIFVRCTKLNAEMYIHANGVPLNGKDDQYVGGTLTYLSFTVKKAGLYKDLEMHAQACSGKVTEGLKDVNAGLTWFKENYKKVTNKKKLTKVIDGHSMTIIGGPGAARTVTCGDKPS